MKTNSKVEDKKDTEIKVEDKRDKEMKDEDSVITYIYTLDRDKRYK